MPAPSLHLPLAFETLRAVPLLTAADRPAFLWGGVAPDVAQLYGRPRGETHHWSIEDDVSGVLRLLNLYPQLAAAAFRGRSEPSSPATSPTWWRMSSGRFAFGGRTSGAIRHTVVAPRAPICRMPTVTAWTKPSGWPIQALERWGST